ncbi:MAG TPA: hypothetical protein VE087_01825, partial [Xanthobacteraceae bacterium]|nr:hypothetical protein [Xanthobacteraceae bacterium]
MIGEARSIRNGGGRATRRPVMTEERMQVSLMRRWVVSLWLTLALGAPALADPVEDFYRGRSVTLLIGYTVAGGYDTYARVLAHYLGRHIPGNPTIVPQNMAGAGSLRAANYLYEVAPRDGTALAVVVESVALEQALANA